MFSKKEAKFSDLLPIYTIEENKVVFKDGRVAIGYEVSGSETDVLEAGEYNSLLNNIHSSLQSLPAGTLVQKIDIFYHKPFKGKDKKTSKKPFEGKLYGYFEERPILHHKSYLFLSFGKHQSTKNAVTTLYAQFANVLKNPFDGIDERAKDGERYAYEFVNAIDEKYAKFKRLDNLELWDAYYQYFNLEFSKSPQGFRRAIHPTSTGISVGEKSVNILSMVGQGGTVEPAIKNKNGVINPYTYALSLALQIPHILSVSLIVDDKNEKLKSLDNEKKFNERLDFLMTQDNKIKTEEIEEYTEDIRKYGKAVINLNVSLIVYGNSVDQTEDNVKKGLSAFNLMNSADAFVENIDTTNIFFSNAPGNGFNNYRLLSVTGDNASAYLSFATNYKDLNKGELICDRFGNPIIINLFDTDIDNQNVIALGPSGSGKSFTMGYFFLQRYEMGHRQIMIDSGGSYKSIASALNAKYYEYTAQNPLKINPFNISRLPNGKYDLNDDKANYLVSLLLVMSKSSDYIERPDEIAVYLQLISEYYASLQLSEKASLSGFYHFVDHYLEQPENKLKTRRLRSTDLDQLLTAIEPFAVGLYKEVLHADENEQLHQYPMIIFDMMQIKKNKTLFPVVALILTELALDIIQLYPESRKYMYMDEAWSMLTATMGKFVENMYRTVRKSNGSMTIITQGINEIDNSQVGPAIKANAATTIVLRHSNTDILDDVALSLGLTTHEKDLCISLSRTKTWREIFIKQGSYARVFRLETPPVLYPLFTSKPAERDLLRSIQNTYNGNIVAAIDEYNEQIYSA